MIFIYDIGLISFFAYFLGYKLAFMALTLSTVVIFIYTIKNIEEDSSSWELRRNIGIIGIYCVLAIDFFFFNASFCGSLHIKLKPEGGI